MQVKEILEQRKTKFIEDRQTTARLVDDFLGSIQKLDSHIKERINVPEEWNTAKDVMPSMWQEPFDMDSYLAEKEKFESIVEEVKVIADELEQEALRCLSQ